MLKLVEEHGTRYWALIGAKLNGRTGKQVPIDPFLHLLPHGCKISTALNGLRLFAPVLLQLQSTYS